MLAPRAARVNGACDQFLAAAALSQQEHIGLVARDLVDGGEELRHGGGAPHHPEVLKRGWGRIVWLVLTKCLVDQIAQSSRDDFCLKWRPQVVSSTLLHDVHRVLQGRGG